MTLANAVQAAGAGAQGQAAVSPSASLWPLSWLHLTRASSAGPAYRGAKGSVWAQTLPLSSPPSSSRTSSVLEPGHGSSPLSRNRVILARTSLPPCRDPAGLVAPRMLLYSCDCEAPSKCCSSSFQAVACSPTRQSAASVLDITVSTMPRFRNKRLTGSVVFPAQDDRLACDLGILDRMLAVTETFQRMSVAVSRN